MRTAHVVSTQQKAIFKVVRNLAMVNGVVAAALIAYAYAIGLPSSEFVPLMLIAVLATVPVALPATFTLATAIGAQALAQTRRAADAAIGGRRGGIDGPALLPTRPER